MGAKKFELDDVVLNHIIVAVQETFYQSLAEEIEFISINNAPVATFDLFGIVGLEQDEDNSLAEGIFKCEFMKDSIFYILNKLYQKSIDDIDRSSIHCAGEFTNIIYTKVKSTLNEKCGFNFKMAVPAVALGGSEMIFPVSKYPNMDKVIQFSFRGRPFCVHLKIRKY